MTTDDEQFERQFFESLRRRGRITAPPLTPERLASLMDMTKASRESTPALSLVWRRTTEAMDEVLTLAKAIGLHMTDTPAPLMRDGRQQNSPIKEAVLVLPDGELHIAIEADGGRKTRLQLSVRGDCEQRNDLTVELSLGQELVEARPLEKKTELIVDGTGDFRIDLLADGEEIATLRLPIGEETGHD